MIERQAMHRGADTLDIFLQADVGCL
jgi:hypothetical protein